jgi:CheY-like chemotaxis protein
MRDILVHTLGAGIDVQVSVPDNLPPLFADKNQLETVLVNLSTNARDAMAGCGTLTFSAAAVNWPQDRRGRQNPPLRPGQYIRLSIADTGTGMDAATLARVTEPFFTTKPQGEGTGLGLAMTRGFVEQSGGDIVIDSAVGKGTVVTLYLPAAVRETTAAERDGSEIDARFAGQPVRLLLVDDDAMVREILAAQLQAAGLIVTAYDSGEAALAHLDSGEPVDALISDLSMPRMDGLTVIREAKRRRPHLPAILLTGFPNEATDSASDAGVGGTFSLLRKPISGSDLLEQVAALLQTAPDQALTE